MSLSPPQKKRGDSTRTELMDFYYFANQNCLKMKAQQPEKKQKPSELVLRAKEFLKLASLYARVKEANEAANKDKPQEKHVD